MKKKDVIEEISLKDLPGQHIVAKLSISGMEHLSADIREAILKAVSSNGGHLSSNLGNVETVVALHHEFDFSKDQLIFDVGHQSYAHKILSGRSLETLRKKGGIAGFQKIKESAYDPYEAGHSSTSISAAEAFAIARDLKGEHYEVIAYIGDGSIANGLAMEALNSLGSKNTKVIVILNDNEMSISTPVGGLNKYFARISTSPSYTKLKHGYQKVLVKTKLGRKIFKISKKIKDAIKRKLVPYTVFDHLGFNYIGPVDGHDIKALISALRRAKRSDKSCVVHVNTIKGHGYSPSEGDDKGIYHDVAPFSLASGMPANESKLPCWSSFYAELVGESLEASKSNYLVVASTQLGSKLVPALSEYPHQSIDMGIAEEHAMTFAGALSLQGFHPIVSMYSTFLQRTYDEILHDCARLDANMTLLVDRAGLVGDNGETHQGIYDVAMLSSIPGIRIAMPSDDYSAKMIYESSFQQPGILAIRYPKDAVQAGEPFPFKPNRFHFLHLNEHKGTALIVVGPKVHDVVKGLKERSLEGHIEVVDPLYLWPFDEEDIEKLCGYNNIVIYDCYGTVNGFPSLLSAALKAKDYQGHIDIHAVPNAFLYTASSGELEEDLGLTVQDILSKLG